ncbi:hypothetical protein GCM10022226_29400 [Sphaerisporangium flaviroseum]|uniref:Uncharacterized protein n=1 Tax=Sphaerisporangium flaviroseum TaxID=509199 RepID=A0ABP7HYH6_9ACTN
MDPGSPTHPRGCPPYNGAGFTASLPAASAPKHTTGAPEAIGARIPRESTIGEHEPAQWFGENGPRLTHPPPATRRTTAPDSPRHFPPHRRRSTPPRAPDVICGRPHLSNKTSPQSSSVAVQPCGPPSGSVLAIVSDRDGLAVGNSVTDGIPNRRRYGGRQGDELGAIVRRGAGMGG